MPTKPLRRFAAQLLAATVSAALVVTPALARKASTLGDLVGVGGSSGETQLKSRGFEHIRTDESGGNAKDSYWWHSGDKNCIRVTTSDGRYTAIVDASKDDCDKKSSNKGAAIAAATVGALVLGAILLSRKSKDRNDGGYQQDWQQVEVHGVQSGTLRIFASPDRNSRVRGEVSEGSILRNYGCDDYNGESWCEVATLDNRTRGWARDRYLRVSTSGPGNYPPYGGGSGELVEVYGLSSGTLKITDRPSRNGYVVGRVSRGATLRRMSCEYAEGENWCQVATLDGRMYGWARDRYLRSTSGTGGYPPYDEGGRDLVEVYNLRSGSLKITSGPSNSASVVGRVNAGTTLRRLGCQSSGGETWCQVETLDRRIYGWARERYLRDRSDWD